MTSKRPPSSDSSFDSDREVRKPRLDDALFSGLSMFLIQTKIEPSELDLLYSLAEANGANIQTSMEQADVIITSISMRKRLERHIDWNLAVTAYIVLKT